jgi:hypothetical protein
MKANSTAGSHGRNGCRDVAKGLERDERKLTARVTHSWRMRSPVSAGRRLTYRAAVARWPVARITLRQGIRAVHDTL